MAVFNTTYNFNQERMNFGKSFLYGALGSVGGGCYGGYGMGMNGSLFSMIGTGIGGCGCGYSDASLGMQIGNMLSNILMGSLSMCLAGRGGSDDEVKAKTLEDYKKDAEDEIGVDCDIKIDDAKVKAANIKNISKDVVDRYASIETSEKAIEKFDADISTLNDDISKDKATLEQLKNANDPKNSSKISDLEGKISKAVQKLNTLKQDRDKENTKKDQLIQTQNSQVSQIEKETGLIVTKTTTQAEIDNAADALVNNAQKAKDDAIEKLAEDLKAKDEKAKANAEFETARNNEINKVDGNSLSRTRASKVKDKNDNGSNDYDEDDVQGALAAFKKAKSDNDKKYWHNILHNMCQNKDLMSSINSDIANIVKKYFSEEYKPE